jgi:hypothetical protein
MPRQEGWSREQLLVALKLYCEIPFGKMDSRNPEIIRYAKLINRTPSALAMKLTNFASLDPQIISTGRKGLSGASKADRDIWAEMNSDWPKLAKEMSAANAAIPGSPAMTEPEEVERDYTGMTRTTLFEARIGQNFFRKAVLSAYEFRCCITGLQAAELLVASHIVPWRDDKENRLNPRNGLCLSAIHDRAFDQGLIAIADDFRLVLSTEILKMKRDPFVNRTFCIYEGRPIKLPMKFHPDTALLKRHRQDLFVG